MKVFLIDYKHTESSPSVWGNALKKRFPEVARNGANSPPSEHQAYGCSDAIIFVHTDHQIDWETLAQGDQVCCHFVFVRSDLRVRAVRNSKGSIHGCYWTASEFGSDDQAEINQFVDQVSKNQAIDWTLLESPKFEERVALRLLAEAWLHGKGYKVINTNLNIDPPNREGWFAPFDYDPSAESASLVAQMVGIGAAEAETLLSAVVDDESTKELAEAFLDASSKQ